MWPFRKQDHKEVVLELTENEHELSFEIRQAAEFAEASPTELVRACLFQAARILSQADVNTGAILCEIANRCHDGGYTRPAPKGK